MVSPEVFHRRFVNTGKERRRSQCWVLTCFEDSVRKFPDIVLSPDEIEHMFKFISTTLQLDRNELEEGA